MTPLRRALPAAVPALLALGAAAFAASGPPNYVADCNRAVSKPRSLTLSCADANTQLVKLTWIHWGLGDTDGTGKYHYNDCTPTCTSGHARSVPVTVRLSGHHSCGKKVFYSTLRVHFTKSVPAGSKRTFTRRMGCPFV